MKKSKKKFFIIPILLCACFISASAAYYSRTILLFQQYNNVGGGTKSTDVNYVEVSGLSLSVKAVTFTPINGSGTSVGSAVTVYDGYSGHMTHSVKKGSFVDLKFRNHSYSLSNGSLSGNFNWK